MEIVMQGGIWPETIKTANYYLECDAVSQVIISVFKDQPIFEPLDPDSRIRIITSDPPVNPGQGNINMQIVTSLAGVQACNSLTVMKTRTDQRIDHGSLRKMLVGFSLVYKYKNLKFFPGSIYPLNYIFVLGLQRRFPFQTQDHVFLGFKRDLLNLFSCPLNEDPVTGYYQKPEWGDHKQMDQGLDFTKHLRMPIWLSGHYFARFDPRIYYYLENYQEYLCDGAPRQAEAFEVYFELIDKVFRPFPRVKIWWDKYGHEYPYSMYEEQGEINADNWPADL